MGRILRLGAAGPSQPPQRPEPGGSRALVLAGGGITGAAFETGALLALDALLPAGVLGAFDLFVGTSAGALLAACLANGIAPVDLAGAQLAPPHPRIPLLRASDVLRPARRGGGPWRSALGSAARSALRSRGRTTLLDAALTMAGGLGAWQPYTTEGIESYLRRLFSDGGRTDSFPGLGRRLLVAATDLDTGERVIFGGEGAPPASVSRAVAASSAVPLVYEPVRIGGREFVDGGLHSVTNLDVALAAGASFVVLVNPLVPFAHDPRYPIRGLDLPARHVSEAGPARSFAQVFRVIAAAQLGRELELARLNAPDAEILVVEARRDDETLFVYNLMDYGAREQVTREAFEQVAVDLVLHHAEVEPLFAAAGLSLSRTALVERLAGMSAGGGTGELLNRAGAATEAR